MFRNTSYFRYKENFSPDLYFDTDAGGFLYTYIRKNASTSFKKLFKTLNPEACLDDIPTIGCMVKHSKIQDELPDEIEKKFKTKVFIYRDPIERVFSVYNNKLVQQDGAVDLLRRLEMAINRDPASLTFNEFVSEYVVLLETSRWEEVDAHLYPQKWHLLPITYNKTICINNLYQEMRSFLSDELCDKVFKKPSNSTTEDIPSLPFANPSCSALYFRKKYAALKMLPSLDQLLTPETEERLRKIYSDDYKMISVIECQSTRYVTANDLDFSANFDSTADKIKNKLGLDFTLSS